MQVLILEDDPAFQAQLAQTMMGNGFNVLCVETVPAAEAFLRLGMVDVLIAGERIGGRLSHPVALLAECRNPLVAAVLRTDRTGPDVDELFDLVPSLVGILGRAVAPALVSQVVLAATSDARADTVPTRLAARWAAAEHPPETPVETLVETPAEPTFDRHDESHSAILAGLAPAVPVPDSLPVANLGATPPSDSEIPAALPAARSWDGLWPAAIANADATSEVAAADEDLDPSLPVTQAPASPPAASAAARTAALPVAPLPAPPAPPARSQRPSPDSPLARVMAAGSRAFGRPPQTRTPVEAGVAPAARSAALPAWFSALTSDRPATPRAAAAVPALPAPAQLPVRPLPALIPERRLHLN